MFDRCLYFNVNALARVVNKKWADAFKQYDLSPAHGYMLRAVLARPGISQKQLTDELRLEKSTITRFVDALQAKGLVTRKKGNDNDARGSNIYATARAKTIHDELESLGEGLYQSMLSSIGEDNLKRLVHSMRESTKKIE
jgi:DNA-binding MarR family transcriptional regulator